ncbi:uncharacterized protein LOC110386325 [Bombyx mori]|uniref:Uncharacterized protein n=1 Tax=Bombyx mori TaxID=7091 RepID=A0A8R2R7E1_BOMMO|nr:uncharacterized protein LOC110386325 isoform X2 [Bombyx mori]
MSKNNTKSQTADLSKYCKSVFALSFAIEIIGLDVWNDFENGLLDLGTFVQGFKIQYQLYHGQTFDLDILVWPHVAKVWCGSKYGWVRCWQFLERRWLSFSIRHAFPVRVEDLREFIATVVVTPGSTALSAIAKNDKNFEVYVPVLKFGERRFFGPVLQSEESISSYCEKIIWENVETYIPSSYFDGSFDIPQPIEDVRQQDKILYYVREATLNRNVFEKTEDAVTVPEEPKYKVKRDSKLKEKKKTTDVAKVKFEIKLTGDAILAGVGRIIAFEVSGERPPELGEVIVLLSSNNLPAKDDKPIVFVNIEKLFDAPVNDFKKLRISKLYTRWKLGEESHDSEQQTMKLTKSINFNDHHAVPMTFESASEICAIFLDLPFIIELRGILSSTVNDNKPMLFGYEKADKDFGSAIPPKKRNNDDDVLIACTRIDAQLLAKTSNNFIKGEYSLYPPTTSVVESKREDLCTNDVNAVKRTLKPTLLVPPSLVLEAQMTLDVSIGVVGCQPRKLTECFSRLFALTCNNNAIESALKIITEVNELAVATGQRDQLLTGFVLDSGDTVLLFVEGPRYGKILYVWEMTDEFSSEMKVIYSSSARYSARIYEEMLTVAVPFPVMKMFVPLTLLLACPPVYVRPALPLPARAAVLKLGRLLASNLNVVPSSLDVPTTAELRSFRLEFCVAPLPPPVCVDTQLIKDEPELQKRTISQVGTRINWDK